MLDHGWPPESLLDPEQCLPDARWQENRKTWAHWITADLKSVVTNSLFGGHPSGMGPWFWACFTRSSTFHLTAPRTQVRGRMRSGLSGVGSGLCIQDRASRFHIFGPRPERQVKVKSVKEQSPRAWWEFKCLAVCRYSRFLWSVQTRNCCSAPSNQGLHSSEVTFNARGSLFPMSYARLMIAFWIRRHMGVDSHPLLISGTARHLSQHQMHPLPQWIEVWGLVNSEQERWWISPSWAGTCPLPVWSKQNGYSEKWEHGVEKQLS